MSRPAVRLRCFAAACVAGLALAAPAAAFSSARIKDIVEIEGVRDNPLVGYGLVVGLNGSGDTLRNSPMTRQSLEAMLERLGVNTLRPTSTPATSPPLP